MGRVQWDPAREMEMSDLDRKMPMPRRFLNRRDIQIGLKDRLSEMYVASVLSIEDVTQLSGKLKVAHSGRSESEVSFQCFARPNSVSSFQTSTQPNTGEKKSGGAAVRVAIGEGLHAGVLQGEVG